MGHSRKPSLTTTFLISVILVTTISSALVGYVWISEKYREFNLETTSLKNEYIKDHKQEIKAQVEAVIDYIKYIQSQTENRLKANLRDRTYEAYAIATHIYHQNQGKRTRAEIKKMITDALRPIRFNNGRGYYFAGNFDGIEQLFADKPELEGKNLINMQDTEGKLVIQDMIATVKSKSEGFYEYTWTKPNQTGRTFPKLSFVKHFEPFNWFIGTGEYLDDFDNDIEAEILKRVSQIHYGKDSYFFIGRWDGTSLLGPSQGKNMWNIQDENGVMIVQELIKAAKSGGGYVTYNQPRYKGMRTAPKISYADQIEKWQWYVGTGQFIDTIDKTIRKKEQLMQARVRSQVAQIALLLCGMLIAVILIVRFISHKSRRNFRIFTEFFKQAGENDSIVLDQSRLEFSEFVSLAGSANEMVALRRQTKDELRRAHSDLERKVEERTRELQLAMEEAESANRTKSEFLANISHELRNPMHHILSYSKYGVEKIEMAPRSKLGHYFKQIRKSAGRLMILLNDLLDLSKMETGRMHYQMQETNIWHEVREAAGEFESLIREKSLEFRLIDPPVPTKLVCDEYRIGQVIRNLLSNAFKFTPEGTTVTVSFDGMPLEGQGGRTGLRVSVSDEGVGIPEDELKSVFDKFTQSSFTKTGAGGTGLGLAICREIIESHDGRIWVENNAQFGATFSFVLPYPPPDTQNSPAI